MNLRISRLLRSRPRPARHSGINWQLWSIVFAFVAVILAELMTGFAHRHFANVEFSAKAKWDRFEAKQALLKRFGEHFSASLYWTNEMNRTFLKATEKQDQNSTALGLLLKTLGVALGVSNGETVEQLEWEKANAEFIRSPSLVGMAAEIEASFNNDETRRTARLLHKAATLYSVAISTAPDSDTCDNLRSQLQEASREERVEIIKDVLDCPDRRRYILILFEVSRYLCYEVVVKMGEEIGEQAGVGNDKH